MKHTKGILTAKGYFIEAVNDHPRALITDRTVAQVTSVFRNKEESTANAARIVKTWNMHDELIEFLEEVNRDYRGTETAVKAFELIAKAKTV